MKKYQFNIKVIRALCAFVLMNTLFGCAKKSTDSFNPEMQKLSIQNLMTIQESSWNQGDISGFMKYYWNNDSLRFIGKRGITYGWQSTLDNYMKSYPDADAMGRLKFTNILMDAMDSTNTYVIGKWELFRTVDTLSGHYSLLWKKLNGNWVIVTDHTS